MTSVLSWTQRRHAPALALLGLLVGCSPGGDPPAGSFGEEADSAAAVLDEAIGDSLPAEPSAVAGLEIPDSIGPDDIELVTIGGGPACTSRIRFHQFMEHAVRERRDSVDAILADTAHGCVRLRAGVPVELRQNFTTFIEVRPIGMDFTLWTLPEAIAVRRKMPQ